MQMSGGTRPDHHRREEFAPTRAAHDLTLLDFATGRTSAIKPWAFTSEHDSMITPEEMCKSKKPPDEED